MQMKGLTMSNNADKDYLTLYACTHHQNVQDGVRRRELSRGHHAELERDGQENDC